MSNHSHSKMTLLDTLIVLGTSFTIVLLLLWMGAQILGQDKFSALPSWASSAASGIWGFLTTGGVSVLLAILKSFLDKGKPHPPYLLWIIGTTLTFLLFLALITLLLSMFGKIPLPPENPAESSIRTLKHQLLELHGPFESMKDYPAESRVVRQQAAPLAEQISNISDQGLGLDYQTEKYQYAAYGYVLAASVENNSAQKRAYAEQAINSAQQALKVMEKVKNLAAQADSQAQGIYKWINDSSARDRIHYLFAIAYAIHVCSQGNSTLADVNKALGEISFRYLDDYPTNTNPDLELVRTTSGACAH